MAWGNVASVVLAVVAVVRLVLLSAVGDTPGSREHISVGQGLWSMSNQVLKGSN